MKQLRNVSRLLVALVLVIGASSLVVACNQPTNGGGSSSSHPAEGVVWKQDGKDTFIYLADGKSYECKLKSGTYWSGQAGTTNINSYTRDGNKFTVGGYKVTVTVSGNALTLVISSNTFTYKKVSSPTAAQVKAGAANTVEP